MPQTQAAVWRGTPLPRTTQPRRRSLSAFGTLILAPSALKLWRALNKNLPLHYWLWRHDQRDKPIVFDDVLDILGWSDGVGA